MDIVLTDCINVRFETFGVEGVLFWVCWVVGLGRSPPGRDLDAVRLGSRMY